ncbi:suppressor of fused domain protein [Rubritalea sp.]|uniref:suppressor of fused domain protein n=1 Tax=Rubritalea sp. TaxID=2109375 RepID=UPI003EF7A66F
MNTSESGAPILRHEARKTEFTPVIGDGESIDLISDHIEQHIGPISNVFHEIISDLIHIDIHIVEPTSSRNFYTLVTSGMSDLAMSPPEDYKDLAYSELMISLPPDWPLSEESLKDESNYWPLRMLKTLARFPHEYQTWLWSLHTIPNGDPAEPYAPNTNMTGIMLIPPILLPEEFYELKAPDKTIHFHSIIPLHTNEIEHKLKHGAESLFDGFDSNNISELLNPGRASVLKKKSWWPFGRN